MNICGKIGIAGFRPGGAEERVCELDAPIGAASKQRTRAPVVHDDPLGFGDGQNDANLL
jgi:hypothetical protein